MLNRWFLKSSLSETTRMPVATSISKADADDWMLPTKAITHPRETKRRAGEFHKNMANKIDSAFMSIRLTQFGSVAVLDFSCLSQNLLHQLSSFCG